MVWEEAPDAPIVRSPARSLRGYFIFYAAVHVLVAVPYGLMQFVANWPGFRAKLSIYEAPVCEALEIGGGLIGNLIWLQTHYNFFYKFNYAPEPLRFLIFAAESAGVTLAVVAGLAWLSAQLAQRVPWYRDYSTFVYLGVLNVNILLYYIVFVL